MKWFPDRRVRTGSIAALAALVALAAALPQALRHPADLLFVSGQGFARWIENVQGGSDIEKALYRLMQLPGSEILFRRPPRETVPAITALQPTQKNAALYSLRALEEEQALDFEAAERDWKAWADQSDDRAAAYLDLADFYERRLKPQEELAALEVVGKTPASVEERSAPLGSQRAWLAWERALKVVNEYALPRSAAAQIYADWIQRYPNQPGLYQQQLAFLLDGGDFAAATDLIARYRTAFPDDKVFPVEAEANLATRRGSAKDGLAVYETAFQPLWPSELIRSYFALVLSSRDQRQFADALRAKIDTDPNDLRDAARLFYLEQQEGQLDSAKAVLNSYREQKDARGSAWTAEELDTLAQLFASIQDLPEAARYDYALASGHATPGAEQKGLVGLTRILLAAPDQPFRLGAGNLALYRNIATMDRGPGYLNGILSLLLNSQDPVQEYASEDQRAVPYFHRAEAAELLAEIDRRFPLEPERALLHAALLNAYAAYGENDAVIREGTAILAQFPQYSGRVAVAMQVADAYARTGQTDKEFALYQSLLKELAAQADGVPLGAQTVGFGQTAQARFPPPPPPPGFDENVSAVIEPSSSARSQQYAEVLDRYLARLVSLRRLPDALNVLRGELDRNPQDPGLYQRLADFLEQNALNAREEEVYQRAIDQFQGETWYAKLARLYLRQRRYADYNALMHKVAGIFSGTELEQFLMQAPAPGRALAMQVNLYAHQRFPHDLRFVQNLLNEYRIAHRDADAEQLLWEHWSESPELRDQLFELLSRTGRLDQVIGQLRQQSPEIDKSDWIGLAARNPAAGRFWMEACLWQSHFEQGVGAADALAAAYPADTDLGERAASLYRSLAYFHPEDTNKAVAIEKNLLAAEPGDLDRMARIGDIYADRSRFADAIPYWVRMGEARPGLSDGYLQSATVFWDYYDFTDAMSEIEKARAQLKQPTLFGYEAGAVEESRGDMPAAVREYVASALADNPSTDSHDRLIALARKPALRAVIEDATAGLLRQPSPTAASIQLRAAILDAEHRRDDLASELTGLVAQTSSFDVLDAVTQAARSDALSNVEEAALKRQIALTTDPVRNLQLCYQLVDFYQRRNPQAAAAEIDAIDRDHGRILGVVRSTVDFDWAHDRRPQAVTVLLSAAQVAYPELKSAFQLEAARKLSDLGDYQRSQTILEALLAAKPLDAASEAAMADNLARAGDQAGLEAFYKARLAIVQQAPLDRSEKIQRIAQLRRGILAAATLLGNTNEAVDQYIELINAFPDDAALAQEAALYAVAHGARDRLFGFYQKTITASPRDPRWSLVLARMATAAEDVPLAIDAYDKPIRLRPERQDLLIAQADLQQRLQRFDDAAGNYQKLYTLSYHDPQWMEKIAELRARQGRTADAVSALETAWITGRPRKAADSFRVAAQLEQWNLLDEARKYAEQGLAQAGADLLVDPADQSGAATYARILARQRQAPAAYARLAQARQQAADVPLSAVVQQVVQQGPAAVTNEEWRRQRQNDRSNRATQGFATALAAMGSAAAEFYTPEEKAQFAAWLQSACTPANDAEMRAIYLPAAQAAGLSDLAASWMWNLAWNGARFNAGDLSAWIQFEEQRGELNSVGASLERIASSVPARQRVTVWQDAADVYRKTGDAQAELRALERVIAAFPNGGEGQTRYYELLWNQRPEQLAALAASQDGAVQFLVEHGDAAQAIGAVAARSAARPPVWNSAYTALTGLYRRDYEPEVRDAFAQALDANATIGDRVAHPVDRDRQLAGEVWFYYGSRYGEYLDGDKDPDAEDYLASELEHTPESPEAYVQLADYSAQAGRSDAALGDYQRSLELRPDQPGVFDSIAMVDLKAGRQADALSAWGEAVKLLAKEVDAQPVPESFWSDYPKVIGDASAAGQHDSIREQVDALLRAYIARNGSYRVEPLVEAGYKANKNSIDWLLGMASAAHDPQGVLQAVLSSGEAQNGSGWIEHDQISAILANLLEMAEKQAQENPGTDEGDLNPLRLRWVNALVEEKKFADARAALAQVPEELRNSAVWLPAVLAVAEADGNLTQLLDQWSKQGSSAPAEGDLRNALSWLNEKDQRTVMRFVYQRALDARELTAPNFLGLAAIDLDQGNTAGAVNLLKRMTLVSGDMYADTDSAAQLLHENNKDAEAIPFLRTLVAASPWNAGYKVRLASAELAANQSPQDALSALNAVAGDSRATYADRVAAARALQGHGAPQSGSGELALLAQAGCPSQTDASKPFFVAAREAAAACAASPRSTETLLRQARAIAPADAQLRLLYIWAAFSAGRDNDGWLAAQPILQSFGGYGQPDDGYAAPYGPSGYHTYGAPVSGVRYVLPSGGIRYGYPPGEINEAPAGSQTPLSLAEMKPAAAAWLGAHLIRAEELRGDLPQAASVTQSVLSLLRDPPLRKPFEAEQEKIEAALELQNENSARQPNIHAELAQDRIVRPRIAPPQPFVPMPAPAKEAQP